MGLIGNYRISSKLNRLEDCGLPKLPKSVKQQDQIQHAWAMYRALPWVLQLPLPSGSFVSSSAFPVDTPWESILDGHMTPNTLNSKTKPVLGLPGDFQWLKGHNCIGQIMSKFVKVFKALA